MDPVFEPVFIFMAATAVLVAWAVYGKWPKL